MYSVVAAPSDQLSPDGRKRIVNSVNASTHSSDGYAVGIADGDAVDGSGLGFLDGVEVGTPLGNDVDGSGDGSGVGTPVGHAVGATDRACDGAAVGNSDGAGVGLMLGLELGPPKKVAPSSQNLGGRTHQWEMSSVTARAASSAQDLATCSAHLQMHRHERYGVRHGPEGRGVGIWLGAGEGMVVGSPEGLGVVGYFVDVTSKTDGVGNTDGAPLW